MEELRKRLRRFLPAVMFTASTFALAAMFVNDWIEIERPVRILAAAPIEQAPPPEPAVPKPEVPPEETVAPNPFVPEPEPADEPVAAVPEPPRKDDPWKAEKERMRSGEARRKAG